MTSLARGPVGSEPPGAARPDGTREPDGTGHPALRGLPAVWLRANCPCAGCQDPGSGQRLAAITDLPADVTVARVQGCYADLDGLASTVAVLARGQAGQEGQDERPWQAGP